ncbi:MAG: hypothetical protein KBF73_04200 [Flavobacteriales bacterium]|nr:hypothetical protein [Flavobacteriales bacterium]
MELLPNHSLAVFDIKKLTEYALNNDHPIEMQKATAFRKALGIDRSDASWLRGQILMEIGRAEAVEVDSSPFGRRFYVDCTLTKNGKYAIVRTAWIIRAGIQIPFLTSCYPI